MNDQYQRPQYGRPNAFNSGFQGCLGVFAAILMLVVVVGGACSMVPFYMLYEAGYLEDVTEPAPAVEAE